MAIEIERKYLVTDDSWRAGAYGVTYRQGYLTATKQSTVRVRQAGDKGYLTIKGATQGISRAEFEYEIPLADATAMLDNLCLQPLIEKTRYHIDHAGMTWEVDEFAGDNAGLIVAEVELQDERQTIELPPWVGQEVSADPRYRNANLVSNPYKNWNEETKHKDQ